MKHLPKFYALRIYIISGLLYFFLVLPFAFILLVKNFNHFMEGKERVEQRIENSTISKSDKIRSEALDISIPLSENNIDSPSDANQINSEEAMDGISAVSKSLNQLLSFFIITFLLGYIFNSPFKRFFRLKGKHKPIPRRLYNFCKKYILWMPVINSVIFSIAFVVVFIINSLWLINGDFADATDQKMFRQFFYISLIASILVVFFVYFWEKQRVHLKYLEVIYSNEELKKRIFKNKINPIRNRLIISSFMTTLLPLSIVLLYLFLSVTYISDIDVDYYDLNQRKVLYGETNILDDFEEQDQISEVVTRLFYYNVWNSAFMFLGIFTGISLAFVYIILFVRWTTLYIVGPVKSLLEIMKLNAGGDFGNYALVRTNDEIGELTAGYNEMSEKIQEHIINISDMNEAYSRFVPNQFLEILGIKNFTEIKLGDQAEKEMTILFADIRNFTELSEAMTPKENFNFINRYLGYMEPVIRRNNGFIDKYIGDSIMALFPHDAADALNAAIEMRIKLVEFNQVITQFGMQPIDNGIGIHTGTIMLGIVGGEGRMDGTVISDAVNLASRVEGLNKAYGTSIIISEDTLLKLENPGQYDYRFLDIVKVKGKKTAVYIFELLNGEPEDIRILKVKTKTLFGKAIDEYKNREFSKALIDFQEILNFNPMDRAAMVYMRRCHEAMKSGVPEDWDGVQSFNSKL